MFKSFVKKFEETTGSLKDTLFNKPAESGAPQSNTTATTPTATSAATTTNATATPTSVSATTTSPTTPQDTTTTTTTATSPLNTLSNNIQPVVDAFKDNVVQPMTAVTESIKDSIKRDFPESLKEAGKDIPVAIQAFSSNVSTVTNTISNTVSSTVSNTMSNTINTTVHLPSVAQLKESLQDVDLYNGSLLLRSYEIKLKQVRTNGTILAERADDCDKKIGPLVRTCIAHAEFWKKAHIELAHLDEMNSMIETIGLSLDSIVSKIESLEVGLSIEIDNYLDNEMGKWKDKKELEVTRYEQVKKAELPRLEEELSTAFNRHEREKAILERQAQIDQERLARKRQDEELQKKIQEDAKLRTNLDKTIQQQLNDYKTSGILPPTVVPPKVDDGPAIVSIEQVVIDENKDDLEKFLAPTPPQTPLMPAVQPVVVSTPDAVVVEEEQLQQDQPKDQDIAKIDKIEQDVVENDGTTPAN
ncbi:hypothetical protein SAMD00019534_100280 [Acytostelium subglobosum LB1]|uniref:hypothetical protein n=1 Tax=Acytostelium subglobosum LB1 TaxID=1410327 RepID=UPI000645207F|nr:hypothetical protein SAMD00019534_100280 [Acytostelium subglobosum LB1]GAM26853.1 hypothetical protein SAMD00019534_100280 [Acytostelium subglobosum LB1]|eukprot:XP_012750121.1 hypothetical protein SAMD00019534_100280 [Acytostelium subglobosum LB1]